MYIEYYIIENLLINYIIISCTSILIKRHTNEKKKWIGAFLGTIYSVAYLYPTLGVLFTLPFKLIIMTFIILTSFTYKDKKEFIRISLVFYLVNVFYMWKYLLYNLLYRYRAYENIILNSMYLYKL